MITCPPVTPYMNTPSMIRILATLHMHAPNMAPKRHNAKDPSTFCSELYPSGKIMPSTLATMCMAPISTAPERTHNKYDLAGSMHVRVASGRPEREQTRKLLPAPLFPGIWCGSIIVLSVAGIGGVQTYS